MKTRTFGNNIFSAGVLSVALCAAILPQNSRAQEQPAPPDSADQPVAPAALPPDIQPWSPLAQVIKLTQAGVSRSVILTYIANSDKFSLDTDNIIYLSDLGVPDEFITAMMQRDEVLRQRAETAVVQSTPPPVTRVVPRPVVTEVTVVNFDDTLAPYGGWVEVEGYGRCWRPTVAYYDTGWQPYSDRGHWINTDAGWYWASEYSWGATFHYGRWFRNDRFGWCWWPDTMWAPSWVAWRYTDDYCGWAPLPPRSEYQSGVGFLYQGRNVSVSFDFGLRADSYTFVQTRDFCDPHPRERRAAPAQVTQIFNNTTVINNYNINNSDRTVINNGIPPERIARATHNEIRRVNIHESAAPVPRGEQLVRDTLIVNRPHFTAHPDPVAPRSDTPRTRPSTPDRDQAAPRPVITHDNGNTPTPRNPPQMHNNNPAQPVGNPNPQTEPPRRPVRTPQDRGGDSAPVVQHQTPAQTLAPGTPFETPAADFNSHQPIQPRQQPQQPSTPRNSTRNSDTPQNVDAPPARTVQPRAPQQDPVTPSSQPAQPPQHNFTPRQNDSQSSDTRPSRPAPPAAVEQHAPPAQPPQRNIPPRHDDSSSADTRPSRSAPPAMAVQPHAPQQTPSAPPVNHFTPPSQPVTPPQRNIPPRHDDSSSTDTRPSHTVPPAVQPHAPPAQTPPATTTPTPRNSPNRRDNSNQPGQQ